MSWLLKYLVVLLFLALTAARPLRADYTRVLVRDDPCIGCKCTDPLPDDPYRFRVCHCVPDCVMTCRTATVPVGCACVCSERSK